MLGGRTFGWVRVLGPDVLELVARFPCGSSLFCWSCIRIEGVDRHALSLVVEEVVAKLGLLCLVGGHGRRRGGGCGERVVEGVCARFRRDVILVGGLVI